MLKVENVITPSDAQMEAVIRGMRNPMNSWSRSDSTYEANEYDEYNYQLGERDADLMHRLYTAGSEHRKYMRMMPVYMDITAPLYWWKEFDTYKVGTVRNSCSTMHKIMAKDFEESDFSMEHVNMNNCMGMIDRLNDLRNIYLSLDNTKDKKEVWYELIQYLPCSYNQRATVFMNYEIAVNIIHQRENHKLNEWHVLVEVLKNLPFIEEIMEGCDEHVDQITG